MVNPERILQGDVPVVVEYGPYVYQQLMIKYNLSWANNGEILNYRNQESWIFRRDLSSELRRVWRQPANHARYVFVCLQLRTIASALSRRSTSSTWACATTWFSDRLCARVCCPSCSCGARAGQKLPRADL